MLVTYSCSCCDDGSNGVASFACCDNDTHIFAINPVATVLAQIPLTYTSSSSSSTATASRTCINPAAKTSATAALASHANKGSTNGGAIGAELAFQLAYWHLQLSGTFSGADGRNAKSQHAYELQNGHDGAYHDSGSPQLQEADSTPARLFQ